MPLPQFLMLVLSVVFAAGLTIWLAVAAGVSMAVLGFAVLMAAGIVHFSMREREG